VQTPAQRKNKKKKGKTDMQRKKNTTWKEKQILREKKEINKK
jgi:hypothetical protein